MIVGQKYSANIGDIYAFDMYRGSCDTKYASEASEDLHSGSEANFAVAVTAHQTLKMLDDKRQQQIINNKNKQQ